MGMRQTQARQWRLLNRWLASKSLAMETILLGKRKVLSISPDGPFVIIGEKINPTGHGKLTDALRAHDFGCAEELARSQVAAGADALDLDVDAPELDEIMLMREVAFIMWPPA